MKTAEDTREFVGGGDRELGDAEAEQRAQAVAESSNAFDRWAESRSVEERLSFGDATSVPEGFGTKSKKKGE